MPTVRLANHSPSPFEGWFRRTVDDVAGIPPAGRLGPDTRYVLGLPIGKDTWAIDVWAKLAPGQRVELDLADFQAWEQPATQIPASIIDYFGGPLRYGGVPMQFEHAEVDGAAITSKFRARREMFGVHVWLRWYPDQPGFVYGEALHVCSNPDMLSVTASPGDVALTMGDAVALVPGRQLSGSVKFSEATRADGQGEWIPFILAWLRHLQGRGWSTLGAVSTFGLGGCGIADLWGYQWGRPRYPDGFSGLHWANGKFAAAARAIGRFDLLPVCGPNIRSSDTGVQEDQWLHAGGECMVPGGEGAELVRLWSACKLHSERPCNHLEADGTPLNPAKHPGLVFQDGRPSRHSGLNPGGLLGKDRWPTEEESHGRYGPDNQHFLLQSLLASARITASPGAQWLMERIATVLELQRTTVPGWSSSGIFSAREVGYLGWNCVQLYRNLRDRSKAERMRKLWVDWANNILLPERSNADILAHFDNDPRLAPGIIGIAWQESLGVYGIDIACETFGPEAGRELAYRLALRILDEAWVEDASNGRWLVRDLRVDEGPKPTAVPGWDIYGMPLSVATVLRHDADNPKARQIWDYLKAGDGYRFMPTEPGL